MKKILTIIIVCLFIGFLVIFNYFYNVKNIVNAKVILQKSIILNKNEIYPTCFVANNKADMYYLLLKYIGDTLINKELVDFKTNDYLVTLGSKLNNAYYFKNRNHPNDYCSYLKELPLGINYDSIQNEVIYIYKIEKGKYRHICP